ncbi:MAG: hypothetical protein M0T72_01355 [Candidatus Dormibacteraeota bacterium]|nr:hypothetical protein [Candidatus Dormibacteraeota bacterium]
MGERDPDAPGEQERRSGGGESRTKRVFGFGDDTISGNAENAGYVYAHALFPANAYDVPVSVRLVELLQERGVGVADLIADRGFSQDGKWLAEVRALGVMPCFDLKAAGAAGTPRVRSKMALAVSLAKVLGGSRVAEALGKAAASGR